MRGVWGMVREKMFESNGYIYDIVLIADFPAVYLCQNLPNCTFLCMSKWICIHIITFIPHYCYNKKTQVKFWMLLPQVWGQSKMSSSVASISIVFLVKAIGSKKRHGIKRSGCNSMEKDKSLLYGAGSTR